MPETVKRVLVVDDDAPIRTMLAKVIEREDEYDVDTARDGAEAIEAIDNDGYSVILLDLMMPRVDGFAVLRHLQQEHPEKLRRTIIATAIPEPEIARRFDGPVYRVHAKPFDIRKLLMDVRECSAGSS